MPLAFPQPLFFPTLVPIDKKNNNKKIDKGRVPIDIII